MDTAFSDAISLGVVEGVLGKLRFVSSNNWHLLLINESEFVCSLHDGIEVRRISKIAILPISTSPLPKTFQLNKISRSVKELVSTQEQASTQKQPGIVQAVQNTIKAASDIVNFKNKQKGSNRFEMRILEEMEKLFEGESDQFYFTKCGGDLTLWSQRREYRRLRGELCDWGDLKICPRTYWPPIWCRYDDSFVWNHRILQDLVAAALHYLHMEEGLPKFVTASRSLSPVDESAGLEDEMEAREPRQRAPVGAGQPTRLTECLCALESMLPPVINGFVKQHKLALHMWDVDGSISPNTSDPVTLTIISRRSQFRAGCRYRRRGIDEKGDVANYVETEQVLEVPSEVSVHVLSFLQIRGSVPVFWTQTGIKYKPPIQLHKSLSENREAFRLHIERPLRKFDRLVVVNLVETAPGHQESKITEAFVRQLLLFNNPNITYVGFDFHEYCKGFRFGNVSVLLDGVKDIIRDMKYCWLHKDYLICKQEGVFRVNCVDCLDRTNLVQSVFATSVIEIQLRKLGRLPPEANLPAEFSRAVQSIWADNGDALSRHYTGTVAMKGDYTRTGSRTVNGLMKDGVSSMTRYYQRFGEIKRQAAIDFLLGHTNSPELRFLQNCSTVDDPVKEDSSIEVSALLAVIRSSCLQTDEDPFFEFVASSSVMRPRRTDVRAFGMVTSKYLHIVRFVDDLLTNQQAHLRVPISSITHIALGTESALFKQASPVLYVYFTTSSDSNEVPVVPHNDSFKEIVGVRSGDDASEESVPIPSTALKRLPLQHGTGGQYRLDLRQAPFRLFNNYLVPISNTEEATDALRAVAESITVLLQSIEASVPLEMQVTSISVRQRWFASLPPAKFTRPLPPAVYNVLQQHRDCLHPFLLSLQPPLRPRRSRHAPMVNRNYLSKPAQRVWGTKGSPKSTLLSNVSQIELEMAAASGEMNEKLLAPDYTEAVEEGSRGTDETSEQEVEPSLGSDVDDMPTRIMKPSNCSSISDLIYELEDAASVAAEEEAEEDERMEEDEKAYRLRISRSRSRSVPAHLEDTACGQMLKLTNPTIVASVSRSSSSPLLGCLFHHSLSPPSQIYERRSSSSRTYMKLSHPTLAGEDRLVLPRSFSCNDCNSRMTHRLPYRRIAVSDPEITCYRALYGLTVEQRPPPKSLHVSQSKGDLGLQEELNMHFQIFTFASIGRLQESANPRFVSRLRQRQEANASAVNQARNLMCPSEDMIKTQFIIF